MHRRVVITFAGIAFLALAFIAIYSALTLRSYLDPFDDHPFDSVTWKSNTGRTEQARAALAQIRSGLSKTEVRNLLGEGNPVTRHPGNVDQYGNRLRHPETWSYFLSGYRGDLLNSFDDAFLYVHFDQDEKVVAAQIAGG